ncbi:MAG: DUF1673 family protein [Candidatus Methanomarinus sp.]|jgi:hypothetical protein|uniref:DUF1673 family protein n=1 Tax=Candidatus Methanomarinus sp. TaxID=3386244 RepID=A0AC61SA87_9EURY|nr:MAG: DUF1673 family protein [ANME-2 cluster archaeon]
MWNPVREVEGISMILNFAENIRKMMGWCPQKRVVCNHNDEFFSENAFSTCTATYDENNQYMDIPVQMFDWRIFAVMFSSIALLLIGIQRSNIYVIFLSFLLYVSLFIFDRTKISVDKNMLRIRFPLLGEKRYHKNDIDKVKSGENYAHKHRVRSLIALILVILISLSGASIISVMFRVSTLLLIYVVYSAIRISRYPEIIKISVQGRNIFLYPRNEHDLLMLKSIAPERAEDKKKKFNIQ